MNKATRDFILRNRDKDVRQLALQGSKHPEVSLAFALDQIAGWQMARTKIPSWANVEDLLYPPHLSMEQCSSEQTAMYKAEQVSVGQLLVDLTAGFGVDALFLSKCFSKTICVERQPQLTDIITQNAKTIGLNGVEVICGDGIDYLQTLTHADLLFIDPARRDSHGGRTYGLADCTPNVLDHLDLMAEKADRIMLKLSPMLDWRKAVSDLGKGVERVHIVSVDNECKELLIEISSAWRKSGETTKQLPVCCVNLHQDGRRESLTFDSLQQPSVTYVYGLPVKATYLYEPNASLMKAGCFSLIAERFSLIQLEKDSHLFVSDQKIIDFPGRSFIIDHISTMNKRALKEALNGIDRANITVRHFPMSAAELRQRLKLQDGGETFLFATTVHDKGHLLFLCRKA